MNETKYIKIEVFSMGTLIASHYVEIKADKTWLIDVTFSLENIPKINTTVQKFIDQMEDEEGVNVVEITKKEFQKNFKAALEILKIYINQ